MNGNEPATKADLDSTRAALKADLDATRAELKGDIDQLRSEVNHGYRDLVERMADGETRILNAIYDLAKTGNKRMTHIEGDNAALNNRIATIEDRLLEVEKRLNLPPAA
jgi:hypothetical protein